MTHGSLFSGIGGFDLAASWMGWENIFHCERDEFGQKVLAHHFPNSKLYDDVRTMDANKYRGRIDVLSGGFPCQPFSVAGKRKGTEDDRHLWPSMLRVIRECRPRYVVGENVKGLVGWSDGMVFEEVCVDLENLGYSVQPYLIPACAKNAPHRRMRVWFVAHNHDGDGQKERLQAGRKVDVYSLDRIGNAPDTDSSTGKIEPISRQGQGESIGRDSQTIRNRWEDFPTVPPVCGGDDGLPKELDGITFPKWRRESIKAYGNAIVPQVAHRIFQSISDYESSTQSTTTRKELYPNNR